MSAGHRAARWGLTTALMTGAILAGCSERAALAPTDTPSLARTSCRESGTSCEQPVRTSCDAAPSQHTVSAADRAAGEVGGIICGFVRLANGDTAPSADVIIRSQALHYDVRVSTTEQGQYKVTGLPPGRYVVEIRFGGSLERRSYEIDRDAKMRGNIRLE